MKWFNKLFKKKMYEIKTETMTIDRDEVLIVTIPDASPSEMDRFRELWIDVRDKQNNQAILLDKDIKIYKIKYVYNKKDKKVIVQNKNYTEQIKKLERKTR